MRRENLIPQKICPRFHRKHLALVLMELQPQLRQVGGHLRFYPMEPRLVSIKHHKIVYITDIVATLQVFFDKMVEPVEMDIREKLARQVTDRDAAVSMERGQQIIAFKVFTHRLLRVAPVDNQIHQR